MSQSSIDGIITGFVLGGSLLYSALKKHKVRRKIQDTPCSKVATAPQGYIELEGFAWPQEETFKSIDGHESVYYRMQIQKEESRGSGKKKRRVWVTIYTHLHAHPFYLVDATGIALIDPTQAELNLKTSRIRHWGKLSNKDKDIVEAMTHGQGVSNFPPSKFLFGVFAGNYRVVEDEILVGSPIYAHGDFQTHELQCRKIKSVGLTQFHQRVYDSNTRQKKDLTAFFDSNKDQKVSPEEAIQGYVMAAALAQKSAKSQKVEEIEFEICGQLDQSETHKLFLADVHESHLVDRMGRFLKLQLAGGALLMTLSVVQVFGGMWDKKMNSSKTEIAKDEIKKEREIAQQKTQINAVRLHEECIQGQFVSCRVLLRNKLDLKLTPQHVTYYKSRACQLGSQEDCQ